MPGRRDGGLLRLVGQRVIADLRTRGVILNREVETRRSWAPDTGERTDIHVDAVSSSDRAYARVKVIVETKGCWNAELDTAIETQLCDRYLKENDCNHGLYLMGWYDCARTRAHGRPSTPPLILPRRCQNLRGS